MKTPNERIVRDGERGVALALALFAMAAMMVGAASALYMGSEDITASRNYRGAAQSHFAAESALTHALQTINAVGVVDYQAEVVDNWDNWLGNSSYNFALNGYSYTVTPIADDTNPSQVGWLRATATGPENVRNVAVARVQQSSIPGTAPGAIYLANTAQTDSTFNGSAFQVSGQDYNVDGTLKSGGTAVPGIATRTEANTNEALNSIGGNEADQVMGLGYQAGPPIVPSVKTVSNGANVAQLNALIDTLLDQPGVKEHPGVTQINNSNKNDFAYPSCGIGCCDATHSNPVISHFSGDDLDIKKFNGNVAGCGIMIVEGNFNILGTINFQGLILVRGGTTIDQDPDADPSEIGFGGNATIYGSLWTSNLDLTLKGNATVRYSSQALAFANSVITEGAVPAPLNVLGLVNCTQVPAGTAGCPS